MDGEISGRRVGRPRRFDPDHALAVGQGLFHAHGYDAVGLAALTERLAIKPPSFYAAFGSKAAFFERVLQRYAASVLPLETFLRSGRAPGEALADLLESAARFYAADPEALGCLVLESGHSSSPECAEIARRRTAVRRDEIREFIARTHPAVAGSATDLVACAMAGLSACAREGWSVERLVAVAQAASIGLRALLQQDA